MHLLLVESIHWPGREIHNEGACHIDFMSAAIGLLALAVFAPENKGEPIPDGYHLSWYQHQFRICLWWGWQDHFREIISTTSLVPEALDFSAFWGEWTPIAG